MTAPLSPDAIRQARHDNPKARARDLAASLGISEAELVAAHVGQGATRIDANPDRLVDGVAALGDVMALTRNESCVHERRGFYDGYHGGGHAAMVLGPEIDLRIFPKHWVHGFAVVEDGPDGPKRSLQVFDAAGDAIHKIHLKPESDVAAFDRLVADLRLPGQSPQQSVQPRRALDPARADAARAADLREAWDRMTDTHQFVSILRKLDMNRLGAYRIAGAPYVRPLMAGSVSQVLETCAADRIPVMVFVGNMGCIQIHGGLIDKVVPMGPWINVMDPRFNLHLRTDRIAEVWCVNKPTRTGAAISVEAFDAHGELIVQIFGYRKDAPPDAWNALTLALPGLREEVPA
jgi:putative hemin transport protein